jgi:hypothetical protein
LSALAQTLDVVGEVLSDNDGLFLGGALPAVSIAAASYLAFSLPP